MKEINFLIDECMPRISVKFLQSRGFDVIDIKDTRLRGKLDKEIFRYAQEENRIIITRDQDFSNLVEYPIGSHKGIVVLKIPDNYSAHQIKAILERFLDKIEIDNLKDSLVIVEPAGYRIIR